MQGALVILGVTCVTFIALHLGGDPTYLYVSERASAEDIATARAALGFDQPLPVQYLNFLQGLLRGDLGASLTYKTRALGVVMQFPARDRRKLDLRRDGSWRSGWRCRSACWRRSIAAVPSMAG